MAARELLSDADHAAAAQLAEAAAALLLHLRDGGLHGAELKAEGDRRAHELLMSRLAERFPCDGVLSEEGTDDEGRLAKRRVWIIDPLDGTREFSEPPRTDWAVHVALAVEGTAVAGAVALPGMGRLFSTAAPPVVPALTARAPRILVSRTRPSQHAHSIAKHLDGVLVPMGSAGAKAMAVVRGEADVYVHSGGQYEWDSAAPVAVAKAAGLHVSRLDGSGLRYNQPDPWLPDLLICHPAFAAPVLDLGLEQR